MIKQFAHLYSLWIFSHSLNLKQYFKNLPKFHFCSPSPFYISLSPRLVFPLETAFVAQWLHLNGNTWVGFLRKSPQLYLALQMLEIWLSSWEVVWKWKFTHTCKLRNMIIFSHDPRNCHMIQGNRGVAFAPGHRVGRAVTLRLQVAGWGGHSHWGSRSQGGEDTHAEVVCPVHLLGSCRSWSS